MLAGTRHRRQLYGPLAKWFSVDYRDLCRLSPALLRHVVALYAIPFLLFVRLYTVVFPWPLQYYNDISLDDVETPWWVAEPGAEQELEDILDRIEIIRYSVSREAEIEAKQLAEELTRWGERYQALPRLVPLEQDMETRCRTAINDRGFLCPLRQTAATSDGLIRCEYYCVYW